MTRPRPSAAGSARNSAIAWADPDSPGAAASLALLNSRFMAIAGGTVQMQRNTIGEKVLALPPDPVDALVGKKK